MDSNGRILKAVIAVVGISLVPLGATLVQAQSPGDRPIVPLTGKVPLGPSPDAYAKIIKNPAVVVALGKALFWDTQVASANNQACASCHFHAGADTRTINQLDPGLRREPSPPGNTTFGGEFNPPGGFANPAPNSGNTSMFNGRPAGPKASSGNKCSD